MVSGIHMIAILLILNNWQAAKKKNLDYRGSQTQYLKLHEVNLLNLTN